MIFQIDQTFYNKVNAPVRAQLYCDIITHGHYVDCHPKLRDQFYNDIATHGSTIQKNMMQKDPSLNLSTMFMQYLTPIDVNSFSLEQLQVMIKKPALLMVENEANERDVFTDIIHKYAKKDRNFKSLFAKLEESLENEDFDFDQAGGCTQLVSLYQSHDKGKYHHTANWKICILADRDTNSPTAIMDDNKKGFLAFTCGKDVNTVTDADIYNLNQNPVIWHIWYFREIENYFPDKQFKAIKLDPNKAKDKNPDWHYRNLGTIPGYDKKNLSKLTNGMSYDDYEDGLQHFSSEGGKSEMQLFLLKLVRII